MRTIIAFVVATLVATTSVGASQQQFCAGFERGYIAGYKKASGSGFAPFTPFCPSQPFKSFSDPASDFEHGYTIGYEAGIEAGYR